MRKNTLFFLGLCAFFLIIYESQAVPPKQSSDLVLINENDLPPRYSEIVLQGELMYYHGPDAVDAGVGDYGVCIQFNEHLGNVDIALYNASGLLLYNNVINTDVQQSVQIPMVIIAGEEYLLELNNSNGLAEGYFER